jgi:glycosyltransferase involved in cell wall biosynthesis
MRGGEKVLAELLEIFPSADLFTLFRRPGAVTSQIESRVRGTSFLQRIPGITKHYRNWLPLYPAAIRSLDLEGYDLILSNSHAVAKSARVPSGARHVSYVLTPMRYIWEEHLGYFHFGPGRAWKRLAMKAAGPWLRDFDRRTAAGVALFIAISEHVRERIRRAYGKEALVVYPPVDTDFFTHAETGREGGYYLVVSSLEPYKRIDLAVKAFSGGKRTLLVAGDGTLANGLRKIARPPVEFLGAVSDERLRDLYRNCRALIFPGIEDFGIVPVEVQACGRPVICFGSGGAVETVVDGRTGLHFKEQSPESLQAAVERFENLPWDPGTIRVNSLRFSRHVFRERMSSICVEEQHGIATA